MTSTTDARWANEPFVMGTPEQFAQLRELFGRLRFTEAGVCAAAGIETVYELPALKVRTDRLVDPSDPQSLLVQLLIDGEPVRWTTVRDTLGRELEILEELGLLQTSILDKDFCTASVALYPDEAMYIASDKHSNLDSVAIGVPGDIVYSAMTPETHRFADLMPRRQCTDYLELCSGTGIAALIAARTFAANAWAVDITERSTRFAQFNAALNGLENVTAIAGDLYEPVAGKTFDVIVAHPPYVPSFETEMVFRDGGEDGEQITRRIIAGLGEHLRPGGQFHCDCMMTDRIDAPLEKRIREMLGPSASDFDIILGQAGILEPEDFLIRMIRTQNLPPDALSRRRDTLERLGVERFVNAAFLIQRRKSARPVVTRRRMVSSATTAEHFQSYLQWSTTSARWGENLDRLLESRPRRSPDVELHSHSAWRGGRWTVVESSLVTRTPFATEANCPAWFATLLARCDGAMTAREHLKHLRDIGVIPESGAEREFAVLIGRLIDGGFVVVDFPDSSLDDEESA